MRRSILSDPKTLASIGVRSLFWYTPLRRFTFYRYWYNHTPEQLAFFIKCINQTREIPGDIFELGCSNGHTAIFLNQHLQAVNIDKNYYCLDTFDGFTPEDCAFEVQKRGKSPRQLGGFRSNRVKWLEYTLRRNRCKNTFCIKADVESYEFERATSFCLVDLALYRPTLAALEKIWDKLSPGGLAVICYCKTGTSFDGAMQAYREFTEAHGIQPRIFHDRLGLIQKPPSTANSLTESVSAMTDSELVVVD
jgi:O-methyltransferase